MDITKKEIRIHSGKTRKFVHVTLEMYRVIFVAHNNKERKLYCYL